MQDAGFDHQTAQFAEIALRFFSRRSRFRAVLPEAITGLKESFYESQPEGRADRNDYELMYRITSVLARQRESSTMGELSRVLGIPLSTTTRVVDWLVNNSFVERLTDPRDRRVVRVALTEAGQAMYRSGNAFVRRRIEHVLRHFTPEERGTLIALMDRLMDALEEEEDPR